MAKVTHEFDLYGKHYTLETGELAKQATGECLVKCGDSTVNVTVVVSKERKDYDFFPLTVDFIEKMYAVGRIPGGYLKREARPTEKATLTARMIDRPLRPSFPDGFRNEVQVVAMPLVADQVHPVDTIAIMGASAALTVGGVPFEGPLACVRIGRDRDTKEFIVNPTYEEQDNSDLDLELAGSATYISMLEAGADEISEEDMLAAMTFGQEAIAAFCEEQKKFFDEVVETNGPLPVREYELDKPVAEVHDRVFAHMDEMKVAIKSADKETRETQVADLKERIRAEFSEEEQDEWSRAIPVELKQLEKHAMRQTVVETGLRVDGRRPDEVRPLYVKGNYLPLVHGSGLFQRGQTQVLSICTLGMLNEWQRLDTIEPIDGKRYMHHYNFPPFCTGETGRMGSPKRREIGHGALAERALRPVIPSEDEFPYAIRVVSEVMESNGSSSMASTCGSTLALMDAGVPIKRPVSGVAMGLIQEEGKTVVLTDIQGVEDFLGDMDFKVTGTTKGITAMQMDNKATGLTPDSPTRAACSSSTRCSTRCPPSARTPRSPLPRSSRCTSRPTRSATSSAPAARSSAASRTTRVPRSTSRRTAPSSSPAPAHPARRPPTASTRSSRCPSPARSTPAASSPSRTSAPSSRSCPARTACCTFPTWRRATWTRSRTCSTWATRSRSSSSPWTRRARSAWTASTSPRRPRAPRVPSARMTASAASVTAASPTPSVTRVTTVATTAERSAPRAVTTRARNRGRAVCPPDQSPASRVSE